MQLKRNRLWPRDSNPEPSEIPGAVQVAQEIAVHAAEEALTEREVVILQLVASGKANKIIAHELSLSEDTVKAHLRNIFAKLDVDDRTQAVTTALRRGIITL